MKAVIFEGVHCQLNQASPSAQIFLSFSSLSLCFTDLDQWPGIKQSDM